MDKALVFSQKKLKASKLLGLERKSFDNKHVTFEEHVTTEHNMWHYLYFTVLVKVKDPTEFTGPESYVHEMVKVEIIKIYFIIKYFTILF